LLFDAARSGEKVENLREKDPEDETRKIDIIAEQEYIIGLENNVGVPYLLLTEESGEIEVGKSNPDLMVFVDPLDGTDLAIRRIPLCATSICFYSKTLGEFLASVVGDIFTGLIYYASKSQSGAYMEGNDFGPIRIFPSRVKSLSDAFIANYAIKPQRLVSLGEQKNLILKSLRMFNTEDLLKYAELHLEIQMPLLSLIKVLPAMIYTPVLLFYPNLVVYVIVWTENLWRSVKMLITGKNLLLPVM
jgi:fructose-1,6-bisphosphatase/inositol monophosphatase family enzyme